MSRLAPLAKQQFFDSNCDPLSGGRVYTYAAGTTTPLVTYKNKSGTPNTNPIILDAAGRADIWLGFNSYKFVVNDFEDALVYTTDNIEGELDPSAGYVARGYMRSSQNIVKDDTREVVWTHTQFDTQDFLDVVSGRYTAQYSARVLVMYSLQVKAGATAPTDVSTFVSKNGTTESLGSDYESTWSANQERSMKGFALLDLAANDYLSVNVFSTDQDVTIQSGPTSEDVSYVYIYETARAGSSAAASQGAAAANAEAAELSASNAAASATQASTDRTAAENALAAAVAAQQAAETAANTVQSDTRPEVEGSVANPTMVAAGDQLSVTSVGKNELHFISGATGNVDSLNTKPIADGNFVGQTLSVVNPVSSSHYVRFTSGVNLVLKSDLYLRPGYSATFVYVASGVWMEINRSH